MNYLRFYVIEIVLTFINVINVINHFSSNFSFHICSDFFAHKPKRSWDDKAWALEKCRVAKN